MRGRILIVDDHPLIALGLQLALAARGWEVETMSGPTAAAVVARACTFMPDCILLDLHLDPGMGSGVSLIRPLRRVGCSVVMLTGESDSFILASCLEAGALGWISKGTGLDEVVSSIEDVIAGRTLIGCVARETLLEDLRVQRARLHRTLSPFERLSPRERRVLGALIDGMSAEEIAESDFVSLATIRSQIRGILQKLGVRSQLAAVAQANRAGWRSSMKARASSLGLCEVDVLTSVLCGVAGLIVGTFLTTLITRVPPAEPLLRPGPSCPSCRKRLRGIELVPIVSWVWLRGACRGCHVPIGVRSPVVELTTSLLFGITAWRLGPTPELVAVLAFVAGGVTLAAIDLEHHRLPTPLVRATVGLVSVGFVVAAAVQGAIQPLVTAAAGGALFCGLLLVVHLISPRSIGFGDVRLAVVLGAVLGWYGLSFVVWGLFLGHALAAAAGLAVGLRKRRVRGMKIAFGPPLIAGALLVVLLAGPAPIG